MDETRAWKREYEKTQSVIEEKYETKVSSELPDPGYFDLDYEDPELSPEVALTRSVCKQLNDSEIVKLKVLAYEYQLSGNALHAWLHIGKLRDDRSYLYGLAASVVDAVQSSSYGAYDTGLVTGIVESFGDFGELEAAQDFVRELEKSRRVDVGASEWVALLLLTTRMGDRDRFRDVLRGLRRHYSDQELLDLVVRGLRGRRDVPVDLGVLVDTFVQEDFIVGDEAMRELGRTKRGLQESPAIDQFGFRASLQSFSAQEFSEERLHMLWKEILKAAALRGTTDWAELLKGMELDECRPLSPWQMHGVLKDLLEAKGPAAVSSLFESLNYDPKYVNISVTAMGFKAAKVHGDEGRAECIRKKLRDMDGNSRMQLSAQMNVFAESGDVQSMEIVLSRIVARYEAPNEIILGTIMKGYTNAKRYISAINKGRELSRLYGIEWDMRVYSTAIRALVHGEDLEGAEALVREMEAAGIPLNDWIKATLLSGYAKAGFVESAEQILETIEDRKGPVVVTTILQAYSQGGLVRKAMETMEWAIRNRVEIDTTVYVVFMDALLSNGRIHEAVQAFKNIAAMDPKIQHMKIYNSLLHSFALAKDELGVEMIKKTIEESELEFDIVTCTIIMKNYRGNGQYYLAVECFREMRMRGLVPDQIAWKEFIVASSEAGLLEEAMEELDDAFRRDFEEKPGEEPILHTIGKMEIKSRQGELEQVITTMRDAKARGRVVSDLHIIYIKSLLILERKDLAEQALEEMVATDTESRSPRVQNDLLRAVPAKDSIWLMAKMVALGWEVKKSVELVYVQKLCLAEQYEYALRFLENRGPRAASSMYQCLIDLAARNSRHDVIQSAEQQAKERGFKVSSKVVDNPPPIVRPDFHDCDTQVAGVRNDEQP